MKNKLFKIICAILALLMMLPFSAYADTSDEHYDTFNDHRLKSGVGNVTCSNRIDVSAYPQLWNAAEKAIADWDWHLGLLNEEFGVNWNMTSSGPSADSDITIVEKPENFGWDDVFYGLTGHYGFRESDGGNRNTFNTTVDPLYTNWASAVIWIDIEALDDNYHLEDFYFCKKLINHEIGHALGLAHYDKEDSDAKGDDIDYGVLMFDDILQSTADVPTRADLMGIYHLYK